MVLKTCQNRLAHHALRNSLNYRHPNWLLLRAEIPYQVGYFRIPYATRKSESGIQSTLTDVKAVAGCVMLYTQAVAPEFGLAQQRTSLSAYYLMAFLYGGNPLIVR